MTPSEKTIYDYLLDYSVKCGDDIFLFDEEKSFTVKQIIKIIYGLGNMFARKGLKQGDKVAIRALRSVDATIYFLTLQCMGIQTWLIDPHNSVFDIKDTNFYITNENKDGENEDENTFSLYVQGEQTSLSYVFADKPEFELLSDSTVPTILIFTSGSTGASKGVLLSQYAFINNGLDTATSGDYRADDIALCMIPIHHVFALALIIIGIVLEYAVFFPNSVDTSYLTQCIDKYKITRVNGVPSLYKSFVRLKGEASLTTLRVGFIGGAPSTVDEVTVIEKALNMKLLPVYGMSECIGISCTSIEMDDQKRLSGVGYVYSMNDVILVGADGNIVKKGDEGEIRVKSPSMASGYLNGPLDTENGYLKTGDLGFVDENDILHVSGRIKDIIICNGLNISAIKVEKAVGELEGIDECAVIGIPDDIRGEIPCVFIVSETLYTEDELFEKCSRKIAKFERPRKVVNITSIPKTSTGKVDKQKLKELILFQKKE